MPGHDSVLTNAMPPVETLVTGKRWFRVYWRSVAPTRFTTTELHEPPWRFSPFVDENTGQTVQALYAGDSAMSAMSETIFRKDKQGAVLLSEVQDRLLCQLTTRRELNVAVLTDDFLRTKLNGYNPIRENDYAVCRDVAKMLYHLSPEPLDGLVFPSYQSNAQNMNLVVFSTRVNPDDFTVAPHSVGQIYGTQYKIEFLMAADVSGRLLSESLRNRLLTQ